MRAVIAGLSMTLLLLASYLMVSLNAYGQQADKQSNTAVTEINNQSDARLLNICHSLLNDAAVHEGKLPELNQREAVASIIELSFEDMSHSLNHPLTHELYRFNVLLAGKNIKAYPMPSQRILCYEARPAPDQTRGVAFLDGHIVRIPEASWPESARKSALPVDATTQQAPWSARLLDPGSDPPPPEIALPPLQILTWEDQIARESLEGAGREIVRKTDANDGRLPTWTAFMVSLAAQDFDSSSTFSPLTETPYRMNISLSAKHLIDIPNPGSMVLAYECLPTMDGLRYALMLDGAVHRVTEAWLRRQLPADALTPLPLPQRPSGNKTGPPNAAQIAAVKSLQEACEWQHQALISYRQGKFAQAETQASRAVEVVPKEWKGRGRFLGYSLYLQGELAQAAHDFAAAKRLYTQAADTWDSAEISVGRFHGMMQIRLILGIAEAGQWDQAQRHVDRLLQIVAEGNDIGKAKQLATAANMYIQDHDEAFPPMQDPATFFKAILPYVKNYANMRPFLPNPALKGKKLAQIDAPADAVLLFSAQSDLQRMRLVAFVDGHVKRIAEGAWPAFRKVHGISLAYEQSAHVWGDVPITRQPVQPDTAAQPAKSLPPREIAFLKAFSIRSLSHLKQLGTSLQMYLQDNDDTYPGMKGDVFQSKLKPYVLRPETFFSPLTSEPYLSVAALSGRNQNQIDSPATTIVLYEPHPTTGERAALFADGHVRSLPEAQFQKFLGETLRALDPNVEAAQTEKPASSEPLSEVDRLQSQAIDLYRNYQSVEAVAVCTQALARAEQQIGPQHPYVALLLSLLSEMQTSVGMYGQAEQNLTRAMEIDGKFGQGPDSLAYDLQRMFAYSLVRWGRYDRSIPAIQALIQVDPKASASFAQSLGLSYFVTGKYDQAELWLRKAAPQHDVDTAPDQNVALFLLAGLYQTLGRQEQAQQTLQRARANVIAYFDWKIIGMFLSDSQGLSTADPAQMARYASVIIRMIHLREGYRQTGQGANQWERQLDFIRDTTALSPVTANSPLEQISDASAFADTYIRLGRYSEAEAELTSALKTLQQHPIDLPWMGVTLATLMGKAQSAQGKYDAAERSLQDAFTAWDANKLAEQRIGAVYMAMLEQRALLAGARKQTGPALADLDRILQRQQDIAQQVFGFSNETEMRQYAETANKTLNLVYSLAAENGPPSPELTQLSLTWTLRRKGIVLDTLARFRVAEALQARDGAVALQAAQLRALRQRLTNMQTDATHGVSADEIRQLQMQVDRLSADLNRALSSSAGAGQVRLMDIPAVRAKLPPGSALIEYVRSPVYDFTAINIPLEQHWRTDHYFAYVLAADPAAQPQMLDLGEAAGIDQAVRQFRKHLDYGARSKADNQREPEITAEEGFRTDSAKLYSLIFAPLRPLLNGVTRCYVSPDSELNRIPFEALVDPTGPKDAYLVEALSFAYLSTGRDLLRPADTSGKGTLVLAGPDYGEEAAQRQSQARVIAAAPVTDVPADNQRSRGATTTTWRPLPGALAEADIVRQTLNGQAPFGPLHIYTGPQALEEVFKAARSPRILHIATHGFYLPDQRQMLHAEDSLRTAPATDPSDLQQTILERLTGAEEPLLRSGFVLAGANQQGEADVLAGRVEDGWVSAAEVAQMNLRGTELVVLSACETGLGDTQIGEGVFGLRRAFLLAGAQTLLTSLYSVPDPETAQLMRAFYSNLAEGKTGKLEAFHQAELDMLRARRAAKQNTHPYYWAGFILVGNPN